MTAVQRANHTRSGSHVRCHCAAELDIQGSVSDLLPGFDQQVPDARRTPRDLVIRRVQCPCGRPTWTCCSNSCWDSRDSRDTKTTRSTAVLPFRRWTTAGGHRQCRHLRRRLRPSAVSDGQARWRIRPVCTSCPCPTGYPASMEVESVGTQSQTGSKPTFTRRVHKRVEHSSVTMSFSQMSARNVAARSAGTW